MVPKDCWIFKKAVTVMTSLQLGLLPQMVKKHSCGYTRNKSRWDRKNTNNNPVINVVSVIAERLQIHSRWTGMTTCQYKNINITTNVHTHTHTHSFLDTISLTNRSLRPDLQFGQWSVCICRCAPCRIVRSGQSTLMYEAKQRPTDTETMCDKTSQTINMTSPCS